MAEKRKILMIIPVNTAIFNEAAREWIESVVAPDFTVEIRNLEKGLPAMESRWGVAVNGGHVMEMVKGLDPRAYDGIFVSDFDRAGVEPCREIVRIPVLGGFEVQALTALALGQTFSIITLSQGLVGLDRSHPRAFGIWENLVSIRELDLSVEDLCKIDHVRELVLAESEDTIKRDGAQAIVLGCTGMLDVAPWVSAKLTEKGLATPVMDPNRAGICFLQMLIRCGLTQSAVAYQQPPDHSDSRVSQLNARPALRLRGPGS